MSKIEKTINAIKLEVLERKNKRMTVKLRTFLMRLGYKRRTPQLVAKVDQLLSSADLIAYTTKRNKQWHELKMEEWVTFAGKETRKEKNDKFIRRIMVREGNNPSSLFAHQEDAIDALNKAVHERFAGIIAIPTGGGKTMTAVRWLLSFAVKRKKKVLWLAHRHELLEQAFFAFNQQAYREQLNGRKTFQCRVVSGHSDHGHALGVSPLDDVVIASKDSLNSGIDCFLSNWLNEDEEVVVVIDEAHHATARTYKNIIDAIKLYSRPILLGLTATPFRTVETEQGLLKKLFRDDIVYHIDLRTLIARGILAKPIFKELQTKLDQVAGLTTLELQSIKSLDILPDHIAKHLADNSRRNQLIVDEYAMNSARYGKTLIFAINRNHAMILNELFQGRGFRTDYIISKSGKTNEENRGQIGSFKRGELDVLINVNMLTEGTDLPDVKTVFLTRPTTSRILMTQMIGRALRGSEAGGTEQAYIVTFTDDWKETIAWVNPRKLYKDEAADAVKTTHQKNLTNKSLISMRRSEQALYGVGAAQQESLVESIPFIQTVPTGIYSFSDPAMNERSIDILVYDQLEESYKDFVAALPTLALLGEQEAIRQAENTQFKSSKGHLGYNRADLVKLLHYYQATADKPSLLLFEDREKLNLQEVAEEIYRQELGGEKKKAYIDQLWNEATNFYAVYFGFNKLYFRKRLETELLRIEEPGLYDEGWKRRK